MTQNINKELESGRSMVEMLGVLAVIGVLSVGSIAGYRYAMNKHYANELLAGASERAVLVTAQLASGREPSLKEFANHPNVGGTFATSGESVRVYSDGIGLEVSGVKGAVCENLIKATEDTDIGLAKTDGADLTEADCSGDENTFLFVYSNDLGKGGEGGGTATCESPIVKVYNCETKTTTDCCPDNGNSCENPVCSCSNNDDCLGQQVCSSGLCGCPDGGTPSETVSGVCCLDGLTWNEDEGGYYDLNLEACGECPLGGTPSETDSSVCCNGAYAWNDDMGEYYDWKPEVCGCPEGSTSFETDPDYCCEDGWTYYGAYTPIVDGSICGCPDGGTQSETDSSLCCYDGYAWNSYYGGYLDWKPEVCGCPWGGTPSEKDSGVCCKNGYAWTGGDYDSVDAYTCGCPDGGTPSETDLSVCCYDGYAWDGDAYSGGYNVVNTDACGSPS